MDRIKEQARENLRTDEALRIAWHSRWKVPRHPHYDDYTPEEIILETWEQFWFENPKHNELQGITKRKNKETGYKYFETGDPVIDKLEEAFARGEVPDLEAAFGHIKNGPDLFREVYGNAVPIKEVKKNETGAKMDEAGTRVEFDNYQNEAWMKSALEEDPFLKEMQTKLGAKPNA